MIVIDNERVELSTPYGPMRTHIVRPTAPGKYPGIVFYTEIFQVTGPIRRTAAMLAGHGYVVAVPEIYHEFEAAGMVLAYDQAGADRGNVLKTTKELASFDADARAVLDHLKSRSDCTGQLGAMGICSRISRPTVPCPATMCTSSKLGTTVAPVSPEMRAAISSRLSR